MVNTVEGRQGDHDQRAKGWINKGQLNIAGQHGFAVDRAVFKEGLDAFAVDHHIDGEVRNVDILDDLPSAKNEPQ